MKYVIILYLCSFVDMQSNCFSEKIVALEFNNYKECILQGYKSSHNTLKTLYGERIEEEKLAIKFDCKGVKVGENI